MNPARARRAADFVMAASKEIFPNQPEDERISQAVKALEALAPMEAPFNLIAAAVGASAMREAD